MGKILTLEPSKSDVLVKKAIELQESGELDEAMELVMEGLREKPENSQLINCAAMILHKAGKTPLAVNLAERAIQLEPHRPEPLSVAGLCYMRLWQVDKAMDYFRRALSKTSKQNTKRYGLALNQIGMCLVDQGKFSEGEKWLRDALEYDRDPFAIHNLGLCLLGQRQWQEGWQNYSSSIGTNFRLKWKYKNPEEPTWNGEKGQRVIVYGEQGIGDEICFASMIPDAVKDSSKVIIDCDKRLKGLFTRSFPDCKVYGTRTEKQLNWDKEDREFDASISMAELGKTYRNSESEFPGTPYLKACPERTAAWKAYFATLQKPVIGIAWTGGTWLNASKYRNAPLDNWGPIFDFPAHFVNLEYKPADTKGFPVHTYPWATLTKDYDDTAALVAACDMVITMQTAVGHLAAGLGIPTWVMVPTQSQWKYGKFETMPWYSCMKVYQQKTDWSEVIGRMASDLGDRRALAVV